MKYKDIIFIKYDSEYDDSPVIIASYFGPNSFFQNEVEQGFIPEEITEYIIDNELKSGYYMIHYDTELEYEDYNYSYFSYEVITDFKIERYRLGFIYALFIKLLYGLQGLKNLLVGLFFRRWELDVCYGGVGVTGVFFIWQALFYKLFKIDPMWDVPKEHIESIKIRFRLF